MNIWDLSNEPYKYVYYKPMNDGFRCEKHGTPTFQMAIKQAGQCRIIRWNGLHYTNVFCKQTLALQFQLT